MDAMNTEAKEHFNGTKEVTFGEMERFYRQNFNTELTPDEEFRFHNWLDDKSKELKRDISEDLTDYDMRGAFKSGAAQGKDAHWPDTYKKPNHPTFSTQSVYNGVPDLQNGGNHEGGTWGKEEGGRDTYTPSRKMLDTTHPETWLRGYMQDREPKVKMLTPLKEDHE